MGNTCKPMAVSFQCMTKFTTKKKKKKEHSIHRSQGKDLHRQSVEAKKMNYLTAYNLKPSQLFVIDCP